MIDRPRAPARFILLGSASPALVKGVSESPAGRLGYVDMNGFDRTEVPGNLSRLWTRGGVPRSFLARSDAESFEWRGAFLRTFVERDLLIVRGDRRVGIEFNRADAPQMTKSLRIAIDDLQLETAFIVYPGGRRYALAGGAASVAPLSALGEELRRLRLIPRRA